MVKIFSEEEFLHPDSSALSFFLAPSSLQRAPSMWNSIKSGFGNLFGNFGWVNSRGCTKSMTQHSWAKERERERKPVTYVTSQRGRVNARTVRESALAADLPSAVLEEGECSWMWFRPTNYPASKARRLIIAKHSISNFCTDVTTFVSL